MIGRPTKYDPKYCNQVVSLMIKGLSKDAVAGQLGISRDTLYEWCQAHEEFSDSIKIGEAKSRYYWEKIGMDGMIGKVKGFRPAVWIFIMKNRFGWRDNVNIQEEVIGSRYLPQNDDDSSLTIKRIIEEHGKRLYAQFTPQPTN
jgi:hypothetical protein